MLQEIKRGIETQQFYFIIKLSKEEICGTIRLKDNAMQKNIEEKYR